LEGLRALLRSESKLSVSLGVGTKIKQASVDDQQKIDTALSIATPTNLLYKVYLDNRLVCGQRGIKESRELSPTMFGHIYPEFSNGSYFYKTPQGFRLIIDLL